MFRHIKSLLGFLVVAWLVPTRASAQAIALPGDFFGTTVNERGQHCANLAARRVEQRVLVACGKAGLWEVTLDAEGHATFVRSYDLGAEVVGLFADDDDEVWVKLAVVQARPLGAVLHEGSKTTEAGAVGKFPSASNEQPSNAPPAPPLATAPAPVDVAKPTAIGQVGRVTAVNVSDVVISLGRADSLGISDRVAFARDSTDDPLAIGVVINVSEHEARVRLGLNERVPLGALATPTRAAKTESVSAPPRVTETWDISLMARPFAALDELGGGVLLSAAFGRHFAGNLHLEAILDPLALADVEDGNSATAANGALMVSYDSLYFEMGAGLGAQTVNDVSFVVEPGSGLTFAQLVRLGTRDGLNLSARTSMVLFHSEFGFGGMVASSQIPISRGYWLLFAGGGGEVGYAYGEFGLRVLMSGNGDRGSTFLTTTAGGAGVFKSGTCSTEEFSFECEDDVSYAGPMAGVGWEWRL